MNRQGQKWTSVEIAYLYKLTVFTDITYQEAAKIMGRSEYALAKRIESGGLIDKYFQPIYPPVSFFKFYRKLKRKRQVVPPNINFSYKSGKLRKIFFKWVRDVEGLHSIPENKKFLIPAIQKWDAKKKQKIAYKWYYFAERSQANPYMQRVVYQRENGICALCTNPLTEADFQLHHSDYDHICTFKRKPVVILGKKTPNCEACFKYNKSIFDNCASRLHAVHGLCNKKLSE